MAPNPPSECKCGDGSGTRVESLAAMCLDEQPKSIVGHFGPQSVFSANYEVSQISPSLSSI